MKSMTIREITKLNYNATVKRGCITEKTTQVDFLEKIEEEVSELSWLDPNDWSELADIVLVCFAMAQHFDIDLLKEMEEKAIYNSKRKD